MSNHDSSPFYLWSQLGDIAGVDDAVDKQIDKFDDAFNALAKLLRGDVVTEVAANLPENIQLVIHS